MSRLICSIGRTLRPGCWCLVACVAAAWVSSGCRQVDLRGEHFQYDPAFEFGREFRPPDKQSKPFAVTNKGQEIEHNLGCQ